MEVYYDDDDDGGGGDGWEDEDDLFDELDLNDSADAEDKKEDAAVEGKTPMRDVMEGEDKKEIDEEDVVEADGDGWDLEDEDLLDNLSDVDLAQDDEADKNGGNVAAVEAADGNDGDDNVAAADEGGWDHDDDDIAFDDDIAIDDSNKNDSKPVVSPHSRPPASPNKKVSSTTGWSEAHLDHQDNEMNHRTQNQSQPQQSQQQTQPAPPQTFAEHTRDSNNTRDQKQSAHVIAPDTTTTTHDYAAAAADSDLYDNEENGWDHYDDDILIDDEIDQTTEAEQNNTGGISKHGSTSTNEENQSSSGAPSTVSEEWMSRYPHAVNRSNSTEIDFAEEGLAVPFPKDEQQQQQHEQQEVEENAWDDDSLGDALDDEDFFDHQPQQQQEQQQTDITTQPQSLPPPPQQRSLRRTNTDTLTSAEEGKSQTDDITTAPSNNAQKKSLPPPPEQQQSIQRTTTDLLTSVEEGKTQPITASTQGVVSQNVKIAAPPSTAGSILLEGMEAQTLQHATQDTLLEKESIININDYHEQQQENHDRDHDNNENNAQLREIPTESASSNPIVDSTMEQQINDMTKEDDIEAVITVPDNKEEQNTNTQLLATVDIENAVAIVPTDDDDDDIQQQQQQQQQQQITTTEGNHAIMTNTDIGIALDTAECSCLEQLVEFFNSQQGKGLALLQPSAASNDNNTITTTATNGELEKGNETTAAIAASSLAPHVQIVQNILQNELTKRLLLERQIAALQSTVDNLEAGRDESSALAEARENALREEHDVTKSQLDDYRLTNETLRAQNDTVKSDLAESQNYVSRLEGERSSLLQSVEDRRVEVAELRSAAEEAAAAAAKETERLAAEAASLRYDLDAKLMECDQSTSALEEAKKKLIQAETSLSNTCRDSENEVQRLERELDAMSKSRGDMALQIERYAAETENLRLENEAWKSDFDFAEDDIARLEGEKKGLVEQVEQQATQIAEMQNAAKDAATLHAAALSEKDAEIAALRSAAQNAATAAAEALSVKEEEAGESIRMLRNEVRTLSQSRDEMEYESNCYKARCDDLYTEGEADRSDLSGARILIQKMKNEKEDLMNRAEEYESQIANLRLALNAASVDNNGKFVGSGESTAEADSLRQQLESMTKRCEEMKTILDETQKKLTDADQKEKSATEELASLKKEKDSLAERVSTYEENIKNLKSQVEELSKGRDQLSIDAQTKDAKCIELEQHIAFMKHEEAQLADEKLNNDGVIAELRTNLTQLTQKYNELLNQKNELESRHTEMKEKPIDASAQESEGDVTLIHFQSERDRLMSEKEGLATRCHELESYVDRLNSEMQEKDVAVQTMQGELNSATHDFSSQKSELQARYLQLEEKAKKAEAALAEQQKKIQHSDEALHHVREELISLSALRDQIHSEKNEISSTCNELEIKLKDLEEQKRVHMEEMKTVQDKEKALQNEVERLDADNEELLVQLGLLGQLQQQDRDKYEANSFELREQVKSQQNEIIQLKGLLDEAERAKLETLGANDNREQLMEKIDALTISNSDLQKSIEGLQADRSKLQKEIAGMAQKLSEQEHQIDSLYEEKQNLMEKIDDLELTNSLLENESANAGVSPEHQQQVIHGLKDRCQKSEVLCQQKEEEIKALADDNVLLKEERESIQVQIQELTQLCASRAEELREKDSTIHLLRQNEISSGDNARSEMAQVREQLEGRHQQETDRYVKKIHEMEQALALSDETVKNHEDQIHSMKEVYGEVKEQLRAKQEQVASMEVALLNSELSLDAQRQESAEIERCKQYTDELEQCLSKKDEVLMDLDLQRKSLEARLMKVSAEFEVEKKKEHSIDIDAKVKGLVQDLSNKYKQLSVANSHIASLEENVRTKEKDLEAAREQLLSLEEDLRTSKSNLKENLKQYKSTTDTMKTELAKKETDMGALKSDIVSLADALKISEDNLSASIDESNRLKDELEEAKNNQIQTTQDATAEVLGGVSSKEEAESLDFMRKQIIALALALEQSELKRAEALDRVMKERKSNADSLRRLGESVKRFYSTVSCGDSS